jgi:phosphate-selective porin
MHKIYFNRLFIVFSFFFIIFQPNIFAADSNSDTGYHPVHLHTKTPLISSRDGNFQLFSGGYYQADFMRFGNVLLPDSANWRAGRTVFPILLFKKLKFVFAYDFGGRKWNEILASYDFSNLSVQFGHISPIYAFLNSISTPYFSFLEVPLIENAFTPGYRAGTQWTYSKEPFATTVGYYGRRLGPQYKGMLNSAMWNFLYAPINEDRRLFVLNAALWHQGVNPNVTDGNTAAFAAAPIAQPRFGFTLVGVNLSNTTNFLANSYEVAAIKGSFSFIAAYNRTWVHRQAGFPSPTFGGYFVLANYFLTGEARVFSLKDGSFINITPIQHDYGAFELSVMYDYMTLNSSGIVGGIERDYGASINWYLSLHSKLLFEYVFARATPSYTGVNQSANIVALRIQTMW